MAVSSVEGGLRPTNFYAASFAGRIAYHDFEGVTVRSEEGERLLANLGDKRVMLLKNHGILVMGKSVPQVLATHWSLQRACEIQLATASMGTPIEVPPEAAAPRRVRAGRARRGPRGRMVGRSARLRTLAGTARLGVPAARCRGHPDRLLPGCTAGRSAR